MNINIRNKIEKLTLTIQGWLTTNEGELLFELAKQQSRKGLIVELGSWKGKSSIWLAKGSKKNIICIDHFKGDRGTWKKFGKIKIYDEFLKNIKICGVKDKIQIINSDTKDAVKVINDDSISLLYIDTAHDYENVRDEYNRWFSKVKDDGIIVFHDVFGIDKYESNWPDVQTFFMEIVRERKYNRVERCGYFTKPKIYK